MSHTIFKMVIGVIGKIGSGKSLCTQYLKDEFNAIVFSCDDIAKEIIENEETDYIPMPPFIFFRDSSLQEECRKKVHTKVFEKIYYRIDEIKHTRINDFEGLLIVVECALPGEMLFDICDKTIYVENSFENKVALLKESRNYTEETTKLIYDTQSYYDKFYKMADFVIVNNGTKEELKNKINEVLNEIYIVRK